MVERRCHSGFALETTVGSRAREMIGKKFDRDRSMELGVERPVHDAHAAGPKRPLNDVRADAKVAQHRGRGLAQHLSGSIQGGCIQQVVRTTRAIEQCLDFGSEIVIAAAFRLEECFALDG